MYQSVQDVGGTMRTTSTINPVITIDDWALLSDGTIAFVRGHDYHVDVVTPDGKSVSGEKLPFDWKRVTDDDKRALMDSAKTAQLKQLDDARAQQAARARDSGMPSPPASPMPTIEFVPLDKISDYYPAIRTGALKPDRDGNLWILPATSAQSQTGELVYDVVSNLGALLYRVRFPKERSLVGFGPGGVVYVAFRHSSQQWIVERRSISRRVQ